MNATQKSKSNESRNSFRTAVLRGLGFLSPPLLTIVIFLWIGATIGQYAIEPVFKTTRSVIVWRIKDIRSPKEIPSDIQDIEEPVTIDGNSYLRTKDGYYVPSDVYNEVEDEVGNEPIPDTALGVYQSYVEIKYLRPYWVIPFYILLFIFILYLLGKFMAAGAGRVFWNVFERGIGQVPLVRNVYSAVKQVSDFVLAQQNVEFSRVVAVEWPRKGIWTVALVTGESLPEISAAVNEPVLSVLIPTSPMPMTGFTVTVKKSETIDLSLSFDQALQYIISAGVAVPQSGAKLLNAPSAISDAARAMLDPEASKDQDDSDIDEEDDSSSRN
jgi:uncharacterized membrane protein